MESKKMLTDNIKNTLDMLWEDYCEDAKRIARRAEKFKGEYLIPRIKGEDDLPNLDELTEYYRSTDSDPPYLPRIAMQVDLVHIWGRKEIAIILERDATTVGRTLKELEKEPWAERLTCTRKELSRATRNSRYLYSDEIFDLLLDYYAHEYIATRIVSPRFGQKLSPETEEAVWEYWNSLRAGIDGWLKLSAAASTDEFNFPAKNGAKSLRSILSECLSTVLDHKALSLVLVLAVNLTDISRKTGYYPFYILFVILLFAFCCLLARLRAGGAYDERMRITKFAGLLLIAIAAWGVSFTGRLINGDLTQSALPYAIDRLAAQVSEIDKTQKKTSSKVDELDAAVSSIVHENQARSEAVVILAAERADAARKFVRTAMADSKRIGTEDYERVIGACEDSLAQLDPKLSLQRANLYLAASDVYTLWGMAERATALTKYEKAREYLDTVLGARGYLTEEQSAEAYSGLGRLYLLEADIRNKSELLEKSAECYLQASEYIKSCSPVLQAVYYLGRGSLLTAQSEAAANDNAQEKEELLNKSIEDFASALRIASRTEEAEYLLPTIFHERAMAKRKLINLLAAAQNINYGALEDLCLEAIEECKSAIASLDIERQQRQLAFLRLQSASLNIQHFDLLFERGQFFMRRDAEQAKAMIVKCAEALRRASEDVQEAYKFNGKGEDFMNAGHITAKAAMVQYRSGMLLGGDREALKSAIDLYDVALKKISVQDNLQQNMYIAANKAVTLFNTAVLLGDSEMADEARRLAEYYIKNYSSTKYHDSLALFAQIRDAKMPQQSAPESSKQQ